jgi:hypothetical protein
VITGGETGGETGGVTGGGSTTTGGVTGGGGSAGGVTVTGGGGDELPPQALNTAAIAAQDKTVRNLIRAL